MYWDGVEMDFGKALQPEVDFLIIFLRVGVAKFSVTLECFILYM